MHWTTWTSKVTTGPWPELQEKATWDDAVRDGIVEWKREGLVDNGSLQCDRRLLQALGIPAKGKMFEGKSDAEEEEPEVIVVKNEQTSKKRKTSHA